MHGKHGESYGAKESGEQGESREQSESREAQEAKLPEHFESKYKLKEQAQEYESGNYKYETDKQGRIKKCYGELSLQPESERNIYAQRKAGGEDRRRGTLEGEGKDDGGHLIGRRFGGSAEVDNIIAQDSKLNRGEYKRMEDDWQKRLEEKDEVGNSKYKVEVDIRCKYNDVKEETQRKDSQRPSDIFVYSKVTDREGNVVDKKIYHFKNESDPDTHVRNMNKEEKK